MAVLSVDLAYKSYGDIGAVVMDKDPAFIDCQLLHFPLTSAPTPEDLAAFLDEFCSQRSIRVLLLDGPQGWKADSSPLVHSRFCERESLIRPLKRAVRSQSNQRTMARS
jgi:hypothetical protein